MFPHVTSCCCIPFCCLQLEHLEENAPIGRLPVTVPRNMHLAPFGWFFSTSRNFVKCSSITQHSPCLPCLPFLRLVLDLIHMFISSLSQWFPKTRWTFCTWNILFLRWICRFCCQFWVDPAGQAPVPISEVLRWVACPNLAVSNVKAMSRYTNGWWSHMMIQICLWNWLHTHMHIYIYICTCVLMYTLMYIISI